MLVPAGLTHALSQAWEHQTRWIQLGRHVGSTAQTNIGSLPQGDPFSPLALNVCVAEAMHRLIRQYLQSYLDDRSWLTTSADQAARIALTWRWKRGSLKCPRTVPFWNSPPHLVLVAARL